MTKLTAFFTDLWAPLGISASATALLSALSAAITALAACYLLYLVLSKIVQPILLKITEKTETKVDDILLRPAFLQWAWLLVAALTLEKWLPACFAGPYPKVAQLLAVVTDVATIALATKAAVEMLKGVFLVVFDRERISDEARRIRMAQLGETSYEYKPSHSLRGLEQMLTIVILCVGAILIISTLLGKNPIIIISGLGAGAAVLMLVFKDSILGVVAGIQLSANDMLRPGDWIVANRFGANGRVQEVTLATVKVLNWDNTIVTIPPYNLISDSFQNWRRMEEAGGRRVARSFNIDMTSVRFLTPAEADAFAPEPWAADIDWTRPQVNLTVLRAYLRHYISTIPTAIPSMLAMVRELDPTPQGLPIEMYFFTTETYWPRYEQVQAQALDHVLATVPRFGLRIYQLCR